MKPVPSVCIRNYEKYRFSKNKQRNQVKALMAEQILRKGCEIVKSQSSQMFMRGTVLYKA